MNNKNDLDKVGEQSADSISTSRQREVPHDVEEHQWIAALLDGYYNSNSSDTEVDAIMDTDFSGEPLRKSWSDAALAAEYIWAMREAVPRDWDKLEQKLNRTPLTRFIRYLFSAAGVANPDPVWRWVGLSSDAQLDVGSAREFGKLAVALRLPMDLVLASIECELAERWRIQSGHSKPAAGETDFAAPHGTLLERSDELRPFQLMDLRLIQAEIRGAYGDF